MFELTGPIDALIGSNDPLDDAARAVPQIMADRIFVMPREATNRLLDPNKQIERLR
ncbi:MAG TPA: hypothetical protein VMS98_07225 [Thermoanaerobaculia bacterium]|nr:hypothetical protein [Thermoanaerobaculia bacterium]